MRQMDPVFTSLVHYQKNSRTPARTESKINSGPFKQPVGDVLIVLSSNSQLY